MPSGRTHDRITLWTMPLLAAGTLLATRSSLHGLLATGAYLFGGLMLSPDLDIHSRPYKRWGPLRWIWLPYRKAMAHRSMLSHGPLLGTVLRILYLGTWVLVAVAIAVVCWAQLQSPKQWQTLSLVQLEWLLKRGQEKLLLHPAETLLLFLGLEAGAMSHALSDWSSSAVKRWRKARAKRIKARQRKPRKRG